MQPRITLLIENHIPVIIYQPEDGINRNMVSGDENLSEIIQLIADKLGFTEEANKSEDNNLEYIMRLTAEGDERIIEEIPKPDKYGRSFGIKDSITSKLDEAIGNIDKYNEIKEMSEAVMAELLRNQKLDILASIIEMIYNIIIAKVLIFASDLGTGQILIDDKNGYTRLREKMASELSKVDIDLEII